MVIVSNGSMLNRYRKKKYVSGDRYGLLEYTNNKKHKGEIPPTKYKNKLNMK